MWIETDLEPDDVLALYVLPNAKYYVVGEGNANIKYNRMVRYCQLLGNNNAIVIEGISSDKIFELDGKEFNNLETNTCTETYINHFINFATGHNPIMFSLKPMKELVGEYIKDPILIKYLVSKVTLYVYGGFNFRCIASDNKKELLELIKSFKKVCIYESFFVSGEMNSMNKHNAPNLYNYLNEQQNDFTSILSKLTYNWNRSILGAMVESFNSSDLDPNEQKRHQKVVDNIMGNEKFQYVIADFALAAVYRDVDPVPITNLKLDGYTTFDSSDITTNLYSYRDIPVKKIEWLTLKYIINRK